MTLPSLSPMPEPRETPTMSAGRELDEIRWLTMERDDYRQRAEWAEQSAHARWQQLERQAEQIKGLELSRDEWKALALKYGTMSDAEKWRDRNTLCGRVMVSLEIIKLAKADAITAACVDLAHKMRAEAKL